MKYKRKKVEDIMGLDISKGLEGKVMVPELAESSKVVEPAVQRAPAELPLAQPLDGPRQRDAIEDWAYARHFNNNNYTDAQLKESPITTLLNKPIRPDLKGYGAEPLGFVADGVQIPFEGVAYVAGKTPFIGNILEKSFKYGGRLTGGVVRAVPGFGPDSTDLLTHPGKAITENTGPSIETIITDVALGLFINYMRRDHDHKNSGGSSRPSDAPPIPIDGAK